MFKWHSILISHLFKAAGGQPAEDVVVRAVLHRGDAHPQQEEDPHLLREQAVRAQGLPRQGGATRELPGKRSWSKFQVEFAVYVI